MTSSDNRHESQPPLRRPMKTLPMEALRAYWHPVSIADEVVPDKPIAVQLLGEEFVLYRTRDGRAHALGGLCIHRGTPLSMATVEDDTLVCPYHGWAYDATGRCVRIPQLLPGRSIPPKARVARYRLEERYGLIWVCLEEPRIPFHDYLPEWKDPTYRVYLYHRKLWHANAARIQENSLDQGHFAFVHDGYLGSRDHPELPPLKLDVLPDGQFFEFDTMTPGGAGRRYDGLGKEHVENRLWLPFVLRRVRTVDPERRDVLLQALQPVSERETYQYLFLGRNFDFHLTREDTMDFTEAVNAQDRRIVETQRPEELPLDLAEEMHVDLLDDTGVAYRRQLREIGLAWI